MEFYTTLSTVRFPSGTKLALNHKQAIPRKHLLKPDVDGMVIAMEPLEFKAGETIGLVSVPLALKAQLQLLEFDDEGDAEVFGIDWLAMPEIEEAVDWRSDDAESGEQQPSASGDLAPVPEDQQQLEPSNLNPVAEDQKQSESGDPAPVPEDQEQPASADLAPINADACTDGLTAARAVLVDKSASDTPAETVKRAKKSR